MNLSKLLIYILVIIHLVLFFWGLAGFIEYFFEAVPWRLQNTDFPPGIQFLHWLAIFTGGTVFLLGYFKRWGKTPFAMTIVYSVMATLCAVQTLDLMTSDYRYWAMVSEYMAYAGILVFLYQNKEMKAYFNR